MGKLKRPNLTKDGSSGLKQPKFSSGGLKRFGFTQDLKEYSHEKHHSKDYSLCPHCGKLYNVIDIVEHCAHCQANYVTVGKEEGSSKEYFHDADVSSLDSHTVNNGKAATQASKQASMHRQSHPKPTDAFAVMRSSSLRLSTTYSAHFALIRADNDKLIPIFSLVPEDVVAHYQHYSSASHENLWKCECNLRKFRWVLNDDNQTQSSFQNVKMHLSTNIVPQSKVEQRTGSGGLPGDNLASSCLGDFRTKRLGGQFSVSLLKSMLQKAIRRRMPRKAVRLAWAIIESGNRQVDASDAAPSSIPAHESTRKWIGKESSFASTGIDSGGRVNASTDKSKSSTNGTSIAAAAAAAAGGGGGGGNGTGASSASSSSGMSELLRRLPIICLEDTALHPALPVITWLMMAHSKSFQLSHELISIVLLFVLDLASATYKDLLLIEPPADSDNDTNDKQHYIFVSRKDSKRNVEEEEDLKQTPINIGRNMWIDIGSSTCCSTHTMTDISSPQKIVPSPEAPLSGSSVHGTCGGSSSSSSSSGNSSSSITTPHTTSTSAEPTVTTTTTTTTAAAAASTTSTSITSTGADTCTMAVGAVRTLLASIAMRASFGGMTGDVQMMEDYTMAWYYRLLRKEQQQQYGASGRRNSNPFHSQTTAIGNSSNLPAPDSSKLACYLHHIYINDFQPGNSWHCQLFSNFQHDLYNKSSPAPLSGSSSSSFPGSGSGSGGISPMDPSGAHNCTNTASGRKEFNPPMEVLQGSLFALIHGENNSHNENNSNMNNINSNDPTDPIMRASDGPPHFLPLSSSSPSSSSSSSSSTSARTSVPPLRHLLSLTRDDLVPEGVDHHCDWGLIPHVLSAIQIQYERALARQQARLVHAHQEPHHQQHQQNQQEQIDRILIRLCSSRSPAEKNGNEGHQLIQEESIRSAIWVFRSGVNRRQLYPYLVALHSSSAAATASMPNLPLRTLPSPASAVTVTVPATTTTTTTITCNAGVMEKNEQEATSGNKGFSSNSTLPFAATSTIVTTITCANNHEQQQQQSQQQPQLPWVLPSSRLLAYKREELAQKSHHASLWRIICPIIVAYCDAKLNRLCRHH